MKTDAWGTHVSMWPSYFPRSKRERGLAALTPFSQTPGLWGVRITHENGVQEDLLNYNTLVQHLFKYNLDAYVYKFVGEPAEGAFPWLAEASRDSYATAHIANSSKTISMMSIRGERNRQVKLISSCAWGFRRQPTLAFLEALRAIFDAFDYGTYPSPGSMGQNTIKMMLAPKEGEAPHRFSRPSGPLRSRLIQYASGGRADDFAEPGKEYATVYETDFDNFYAEQAKLGVPVDGYEKFGLRGVFQSDLSKLAEYRLAFVECRVTIPPTNHRKLSPFYTRHADRLLYWETDPGTYHGYYFTPMIKEMLNAGYEVEIGSGWGWRELSKFLVPFVERAISCRDTFKKAAREEQKKEKKEHLELCSQLMKGVIVAAIGIFGTRPFRYQLILPEDYQPGDERFLDFDARPCDLLKGEMLYLRKIPEPDAPHLTQILYAIIMWSNVELYKLAVLEEERGNTVLMTNYDALFTEGPPTIELVKRKLKELYDFRSLGKRSYTHRHGQVTPGVPHT